MKIISSSAPRTAHRSGFAILAIVVIVAAALYGLLLSQLWPV